MDYKDYKEYYLYPALFERIDTAFPTLHFQRKGNKWESKYHLLTGEKDRQGKGITYVYSNSKYMAIDLATDEKKGLIDLYMSLNNVDFIEALKQLSELCSLDLPNSDTEEWKKYEEKQTNRSEAQKRFTKALWSGTAEAKKVLDYLHGRKWGDEQIKKAGLGLITTDIRASLTDDGEFKITVKDKEGRVIGGIGTTHLLTIPYRNGSRIFGFKVREVGSSTGTKYLNTYGLTKTNGFFGLGSGIKDVVIVEGELDALHAQVMGANNVVATTGGRATETQIKDAVRRGAEKFTLLFDNDDKGRSFIKPTIEAIQRTGKSIFVASLPDGSKEKDVDEYLTTHSIEDFEKKVVDPATPYALFLLRDIIEQHLKQEKEDGVVTFKNREEFFRDFEKLQNSTKPEDRELLYTYLQKSGAEEALSFRIDDIRAYMDGSYYRERAKRRTEETVRASKEIDALLQRGETDKAIKLMRETATKQGAEERATEFAKVFAPGTPNSLEKYLSEIKEGIPTGYVFKQNGQTEPLTINPGLTFICGYRGHGKTSFLNNIALNEAKRNISLHNGKAVLYFSYEVDKRRMILDLLNTFVNDCELSRNPSKTIQGYFKGKGSQYFSSGKLTNGESHFSNFEKKKRIFLNDFLSSGTINVVDKNYKVEELLQAIKWYILNSKKEISLVCIDYAQLLYSELWSRQRTEEIKKIVNDIKDFANSEGLPFVMAAQFNREVDSPVSVDTKNIGEGGDFERIADTCIGLFNLKELHPLPKAKDEEKEAKKLLESLGVASYNPGDSLKPIQGKLFVRLMKRRYGYYPLDTVLDWEGRTKYITPNEPEDLKPQQDELPFKDNEDEAPF